MLASIKKIIIPVVVVVILFFGYTIFLKEEDGLGLVSSSLTSDKSAEDILGAEISGALNNVNSIDLDSGIFESSTYRSLVDRSQEIPKEPVGRINPFAPLGVNEAL
ncbi:MAG: hypothetical protein ACI9GH_000287 [Candidatus Paceibacteria bacterium]|jgi:hypothetical protein